MTSVMKSMFDSSMLFGANASYIENLYEMYLTDQNSVSSTWRSYFDDLKKFPSVGWGSKDIAHNQTLQSPASPLLSDSQNAVNNINLAQKQVAVLRIINAHRFLGVRYANLDPLNRHLKPDVAELDPAFYGLTETDMGITFEMQIDSTWASLIMFDHDSCLFFFSRMASRVASAHCADPHCLCASAAAHCADPLCPVGGYTTCGRPCDAARAKPWSSHTF